MPYFKPLSEPAVREALACAKAQGRKRMKSEFDMAIDFLEERALDHVEGELQQRYRGHQDQKYGERIHAVHVPIVEQYINEAASAYNHGLSRTLINVETDETDDEATTALNEMPGMRTLNQRLHRVDQISLLIKSCCFWPQVKRGKLVPRIVVPQNVYPVANHLDAYADPSDPDDYLGFILQLDASEDLNKIEPQRFVLLGTAEHLYYKGTSPYEVWGKITHWESPFEWEQVEDEFQDGIPTGKGKTVTAPLQMLTFWYDQGPLSGLIPESDTSIARLNLEIDIALSAILHDIRMHGGAQMFMTLTDPNRPPARLAFGSNFVIPLQSGESMGYAGSPVDYEKLLKSLNAFIQMYARSRRMNPGDFAIDRTEAQSGFAKAVASLPRIEARNEHIAQLKLTEEEILWPRLGSIADFLSDGAMGDEWRMPAEARTWKMRTDFDQLKFPRQESEIVAEDTHNFKHGLDSPQAKLARERGLTEEQAAEIISQNKASTPQEGGNGPGFGFAIARRNRRNGETTEAGE